MSLSPVLSHPLLCSGPNQTAYFQLLCLSPLLSHPLTFSGPNPTAEFQQLSLFLLSSHTRQISAGQTRPLSFSSSLFLPSYHTRWVFRRDTRNSQLCPTPTIGPVSDPSHHGLNYKTPNPKCRLYWYLIEFIDWRYSQSYWYFRPALWNYCPYDLSGWLSPPPFLNKYTVYTYTLIQCERWGVLGHRRGGGIRQIKHLPPSPFTGKFF